MNIIEAIKSGKDFRRKGQSLWRYLHDDCDLSNIDIIAEDWEVKEDHKEIIVTFDPTKPVQTRNGCKAKILLTDFKGDQSIVAIIEDREGFEEVEFFDIDGTYHYSDACHEMDLINVPEEIKKNKVNVTLNFNENSKIIRTCSCDFTFDDEVEIDVIDLQKIMIIVGQSLKEIKKTC